MNSAIDHIKEVRFHPSVNLSIFKIFSIRANLKKQTIADGGGKVVLILILKVNQKK
jgi:glutamate dehydrogenase/leucine dehydrogenase